MVAHNTGTIRMCTQSCSPQVAATSEAPLPDPSLCCINLWTCAQFRFALTLFGCVPLSVCVCISCRDMSHAWSPTFTTSSSLGDTSLTRSWQINFTANVLFHLSGNRRPVPLECDCCVWFLILNDSITQANKAASTDIRRPAVNARKLQSVAETKNLFHLLVWSLTSYFKDQTTTDSLRERVFSDWMT